MGTDRISVSGININYKFCNLKYIDKDVCLVFLHDALGSIKQWNDFPYNISSEMEIPALIYDRAGHGDSDDFPGKRNKYFFHKEAENLKLLLNMLRVNCSLYLIGCSDGGTIALVYASMFPENVKGVITIAAHTFVEDITVSGVKEFKKKYESSRFGKSLVHFHVNKTDSLIKNWMNLWLSRSFREWNIFNELKKIKCSVLALQGEKDEYGTSAQLKSVKENVKGKCKTKLIKGTGHFPHKEKENEVTELIKKFI
jgi:pimeloyl-ACP methyl ester carboxylesterase